MGTQSNSPDREIMDNFRRIVRQLRESSRAAEQQFGLTGAQLFVLHTLAHYPSLSLNEVAEHTCTHQSTVSVVVSRLVDRGLVTREASSQDARRLVLSLTKQGRELLRRAPDAVQEKLVHGINSMPQRDRARLADLLGQLVSNMELEGEVPGMLFDDLKHRKKRAREA